jgi:3-hydroxyacyl-[acyl-carrier-protein] dehydratase
MRFQFVDRVVDVDLSRRIETSTHVAGLDDVFVDHFPGYPVLPGGLVVEAFAQASQLLIAMSHDFARIGRLRRLSRVAFRHRVRPGDELAIRCERCAGGESPWTLEAVARIGACRVATAMLEYTLEPAEPGTDAGRHAERLHVLARELWPVPVAAGARGDA